MCCIVGGISPSSGAVAKTSESGCRGVSGCELAFGEAGSSPVNEKLNRSNGDSDGSETCLRAAGGRFALRAWALRFTNLEIG